MRTWVCVLNCTCADRGAVKRLTCVWVCVRMSVCVRFRVCVAALVLTCGVCWCVSLVCVQVCAFPCMLMRMCVLACVFVPARLPMAEPLNVPVRACM